MARRSLVRTSIGVATGVAAGVFWGQRLVDSLVGRLPAPGRFVADGTTGHRRAIHVRVHEASNEVDSDGQRSMRAVVAVAETGLGGAGADWDDVAGELGRAAAPVTVVAVDRPGFGWSDPGVPLSVHSAVDRLEATLDELDVEPPVVLVGWSLGGLLDLGIALVRPDLVSGLVLVDPSHPDEALSFRDPALSPVGRAGFRAVSLGAWAGGAALSGVPLRLVHQRVGTRNGRVVTPDLPTFATSRAMRSLMGELIAFPEVCDEVRTLHGVVDLPDVPVVLLVADERRDDREREVWADLYADLSTWSERIEVRRVARSGHPMPFDRPDAVAVAVADVAERVRGGR